MYNNIKKSCITGLLVFSLTASIATPASSYAKTKSYLKLKKSSITLTLTQNGNKISSGSALIRLKKKGVRIQKITYRSDDTRIAKVSKKGKVSAVDKGRTTVKVTVKYKKSGKTKTKKLKQSVTVKRSYKNIIKSISLKRHTLAMAVGIGEGIKPVYSTDVKNFYDEFQIWDILKLTPGDKSVVGVGSQGLVFGKKAGETYVDVKSLDGSGFSDRVRIKVYQDRDSIPAADDLYLSEEDDFLREVMAGWDDSDMSKFIGEDGRTEWSLSEAASKRYADRRNELLNEYAAKGKQTDNTPADAISSIVTTARKMSEENGEETFLKEIKTEIADDILNASSMDQLMDVVINKAHNGLYLLASLEGFARETDNQDYLDDVYYGTKEAPAEEVSAARRYYAKVSLPWLVEQSVASNGEDAIADYINTMIGMFGIDSAQSDKIGKLLYRVINKYENTSYLTFDECEKRYPKLRVGELLKEKYSLKADDRVGIESPSNLDEIEKLISDESNLPLVKELMLYTTLKTFSPYIEDALIAFGRMLNYEDKSYYSDSDRMAREEVKRNLDDADKLIPWDLDRLFTEKYLGDSYKSDFKKLVERYKNSYLESIENSSLDTVSKNNMLDKMRRMRFNILYPSDEEYKRFLIGYDLKNASEGGTFAGNLLKVKQYQYDMEKMTVGTKEGDIPWWLPINTIYSGQFPWDNQGYFYPFSNQIMICHTGVSELYTYKPGDKDTDVDNVAYLATTIGHEIGHAFDTIGCCYNASGNLQNQWTDKDKEKYNEKVGRIVSLYGSLPIYADPKNDMVTYHDGKNVVSEAMGDLGGTQIAFDIIKKSYPGDKEAYKRFFRVTARQWLDTLNDEISPLDAYRAQVDVHPITRMRTNGVAMLMDEFYDAFDVTEADAMYIDAKDRVRLWD